MAYQKIVLTEKDNEVKTTESAKNDTLSKFDTSYNSKINELTSQFENITTSEDIDTDIETNVITKTNVVTAKKHGKLSFELKTFMVCAAVIICAVFSLAMYNIAVINDLSSRIELVTEQTSQASSDLQARQEELANGKFANGGNKWSSSMKNARKMENLAEKIEDVQESNPSNWFDAVCDFFSNMFGR